MIYNYTSYNCLVQLLHSKMAYITLLYSNNTETKLVQIIKQISVTRDIHQFYFSILLKISNSKTSLS